MCGFEPRMRSRSSCCRPVISASAMTSAITPTMTPSVEISEMTEMNACLRLATRYRSAMWSSKGTSIRPECKPRNGFRVFVFSRLITLPHQREEDHVADRRTVRQDHHEPVDADALA